MSVGAESVGRVVVAQTMQGGLHALGVVVGFYDRPTVLIESQSGRITWVAEICRPATADEEISYWKNRAANAEYEAQELRGKT